MKNALLIIIVTICSCQTLLKDPTDKFIPGTYIRSSQHEFGKEQDTLIITLQNQNANQYKIERRWKYERVLDGKLLEPEYKISTASAIYNDKVHLLKESNTGLEYSFNSKQNLLFAGTTEYQKIK